MKPFRPGTAVLLLVFGLGLLVSAAGYGFIQTQIGGADFKSFAESRAGEILKAKVKIRELRYLPPTQIAFWGLETTVPEPKLPFSILEVGKLSFGYGLLNLLRGNFKVPSRILLDSPRVRLERGQSPFSFVHSTFSGAQTTPVKLVIRNGEFRIPWPNGEKELRLTEVDFKAKLDVRGQIRLRLNSRLAGVMEGEVEIRGSSDLRFQHYQLEVLLKNVNFLAGSGIPVQALNGRFSLSDTSIESLGLTSLFHDWEVSWSGKVDQWQTQPRISLEVGQEKTRTPLRLSVNADFEKNRLAGSLAWRGQVYPFEGIALREGQVVRFPAVAFPHQYVANGEMDLATGNYSLQLDRERRRIEIRSNVSRLKFETHFELDHVSVANLDWVISAKLTLEALRRTSRRQALRYRASVETDYLVIETEPLEGFGGNFELSAEGLENIDLHWGGVFHLGGRVLFKGTEPRTDLVLRVDEFPLASIQDFAGRPLPQNLSGNLEGKLKLRGELNRPDVEGYFTIEEGTLDKLDFDQAIFQFQGFPPYLKLYDSKILRGRNTFKLTGAINLALGNVFHGIRIKGPDHLVIWKGMSVGWKPGESAVEGEKSLSSQVAVGFEMGAGEGKEEEQGESHALVGPKFKF